MSSTSLYRFYDDQGALLYVGITSRLGRRMYDHATGKEWHPIVANVTVEHHDTRQIALDAERSAIINEHPRFNVMHNRGKGETMNKEPEAPATETNISDPDDALIGMWFHSPGEDGYPVNWQGQILGAVPGDRYVVQLYSWWTTEATDCHLVTLDEITTWMLYPTNAAMNERYENVHSPRIRQWFEQKRAADRPLSARS